jgi:eukaryotic-like serine/threonine-protein kinase
MATSVAPIEKELYSFGPFRIDTGKQLLSRNCEPVPLTPKALQVLLVLVRHKKEVVSKDDLMKTVWPDTFVEEANLTRSVAMIRKALGERAHDRRYVITVPGRGYRFAEDVHTVLEHEIGIVAAHHSRVQVHVEDSWSWRWLGYCGLAIAFLATIVGGWRAYHKVRVFLPVTSLMERRPSIAVMSFVNLSGDSKDAWLSTAFSEMVASELAVGRNSRTISFEEVARAKMELSLPDTDAFSKATLFNVRQKLGADLIILGSFSTVAGESTKDLRVDLRVQDTIAGETIVAISETGRESDLYQLISQVGTCLRQRLNLERSVPAQQKFQLQVQDACASHQA